MSDGTTLLRTDGKRALSAAGAKRLDNGAGSDCCCCSCGGSGCANCDSGKTPGTISATVAGISPVCLDVGGGHYLKISAPNNMGTVILDTATTSCGRINNLNTTPAIDANWYTDSGCTTLDIAGTVIECTVTWTRGATTTTVVYEARIRYASAFDVVVYPFKATIDNTDWPNCCSGYVASNDNTGDAGTGGTITLAPCPT